jgi:hypothetical protein
MASLGSMNRMPSPEAPTDVHAVARLCKARVPDALALLSTAAGLARWNLGLWHTQEQAPGLLSGRSLFGGGHGLAQVQVDTARGWVDYRVGSDAQHLVLRIQARVQPGAELGYAADSCIVTLMAWRSADMDDARWRRLCRTHEVEIDIIRAELERVSGAPG